MNSLLEKAFSFQIIETKKLNGYENENYLITTVGNLGNTFEVTPDMNYPEFVMKTNYNLASGLLYRANRIPSIHPMSLSIQAWNFTGDATSIS